MKKYKVTICRSSIAFNTIDVEAPDAEAAMAKADAISGDLSYSEKDVEYFYEANEVINQ